MLNIQIKSHLLMLTCTKWALKFVNEQICTYLLYDTNKQNFFYLYLKISNLPLISL